MPNVIAEGTDPFWVGVNGKFTYYKPGDTTTAAHEALMKTGAFIAAPGTTATGQIKIVKKDQTKGTIHPNGIRLQINGKESALPVDTAFTPAAGVTTLLSQLGIIYRNVTV